MIQTWHITLTQNTKLDMKASSLDDVTRQLPDPGGYYSTFRTFDAGTRVLGLSAHFKRLYDPVSTPEVDESFLRRQLFALLEPYRPGEARVRAVMTKRGQIYLSIEPFKPLPRAVYEKGVRVETTELQREHPHLKSTSFIRWSDSERKHIVQEGIFEALLLKDGNILEGMTSNFFYVVKRDARSVPPHVCTAREDILPGITRQTVIDIARGRGLEVKFQPLKLDQVGDASEAFITSSSRGVVPVIQIDNVTLGQGSPGAVTKDLMADYEEYVIQMAEKI